tara:strand:- start:46 stop:600 length:555 start_codon:yes stop_codon:yes gene_type:complete
MSTLKVDTILKRTGTGTITLGQSGDTIALGSGASQTGFGGDNTPAFFAYASSNTNIASDTNTKIALNSEYYDTDNAFDTSNYRFTVPSGEGGKYQISFATSIKSDADKTVSSKVYINGSYVDIKGLTVYSSIVNTGSSASATSSAVIELSAGDYIELYGHHDGSSTEINNKNYSWLQGFKLIGV